MKRYVIRKTGTEEYFNGKNTHSYSIFSDFSKAKIYKNVGGAKVACGDIAQHSVWKDVEIVEIETIITDNIIKYESINS